jgi:hypothetical protein
MMPELAQRQNALTAEDLANAKQRESFAFELRHGSSVDLRKIWRTPNSEKACFRAEAWLNSELFKKCG